MIFWVSSLSPSSVERFFIDWSLIRFSSSVSRHWVGKFFTSDIILLRLISFLTGLGCFHLSPGFLPASISLVERFFTRFPFKVPLQQISRSAELTFKQGGSCNNVTFGVEVMWQLPSTAPPHPVWLLSTLGFSLSTPLSRRYDSSSSMPLSKWYVYLQSERVFC